MSAKIQELFVEDLVTVQGGTSAGGPTTQACCEEGPFGCCGWLEPIEDLIGP
ncbi:MAG: hypothetical protein M3323_09545 [Actinomycetota bacterium]|nr:hypothetical protein [Actinomycetota bacterium]